MLDVAPEQPIEAVDAADVLELVEDDDCAEPARCLEPQRQVEQGVERGERVARRIELEPRADSEGAEREPDPRALIPKAPSEGPTPVRWRNDSTFPRRSPRRGFA